MDKRGKQMNLTKEKVEENLQKVQAIDINWAKKLKAGAPVYFQSSKMEVFHYVFIGHIPAMLTMDMPVLVFCPKTKDIDRFNFGDLFGNVETLELYTAERFK